MPSTPHRLVAALAVVGLALTACGSAAGKHTAAPVAGNSTVRTSGPPTTVQASGSPSTTVDPGALAKLLLTQADLPAGFAPGPESGPLDLTSLAPCGHGLIPPAGVVAQARAVFESPATQIRVVEQVAAFSDDQAAALVTDLRQVPSGCHQSDEKVGGVAETLLITPVQPPPAGDEVAGVQLATSAHFYDLVVVRAGGNGAVLILEAVGNPVPAATLRALVTAAGAKLTHRPGG